MKRLGRKLPRKKLLTLIASAVIAVAAINFGQAAPEIGAGSMRVVGVSDGDTITVLRDQRTDRVRLYGVDCPERRQPFGERAKQFTSAEAFSKKVTLVEKGRDSYGRLIAIVLLPDGRVLNEELLRAGLAWWYRHYAQDEVRFEALEQQARTGKKGIWSEPDPVPPWRFRHKDRQKRKRS